MHGVALLGWPSNEEPPPTGLDAVAALVTHLGVALDNHEAMADLEAAQRGVVHKLQEAVRPPTPTVPQIGLGVHYLAADQWASTGGDLYDWVLLPDGDLHLAVVDVTGKGVAATKDATAVTTPCDARPGRVRARAGHHPGRRTGHRPKPRPGRHLDGRPLRPSYRPASTCGGGHPPVLVVADGCVSQVEAGGVPIGFPGAGSDHEVTVTLERSDTVIFYTDGLIETTKDMIKGLESLARYAGETASYPAASMARALVDRALEGAVRRDDSLALVLRRRSPPPDTVHLPLAPFEYRFTPTTAAVPLARHFLQDWLVRVPVEPAEAADLLLVATELAANAIRHATGLRGSVLLRASVQGLMSCSRSRMTAGTQWRCQTRPMICQSRWPSVVAACFSCEHSSTSWTAASSRDTRCSAWCAGQSSAARRVKTLTRRCGEAAQRLPRISGLPGGGTLLFCPVASRRKP